mmetsp:Transcript_2376/g.5480  ORF Transcript_2376/g.5480 Transcript_2376/m.5480 type:complete len:130 (-) Transcript_2376:2051-2440(-)
MTDASGFAYRTGPGLGLEAAVFRTGPVGVDELDASLGLALLSRTEMRAAKAPALFEARATRRVAYRPARVVASAEASHQGGALCGAPLYATRRAARAAMRAAQFTALTILGASFVDANVAERSGRHGRK